MHDCRQTQAQLTDLACDELAPDARERVLAEVADCAACQVEYLALAALLRTCAQAKTFAQPPEDFWPGYSARLDARLRALEREPRPAPAVNAPPAPWLSALRRTFTARLHVPVPVAVAAALALVVTSALALRGASARALPPAPEAASSAPVVRVVEVPVVQEKIVTRTVYVTRRDGGQARQGMKTTQSNNAQLARRSKQAQSEQTPGSALAGFQPAGEVKLRVIKGSFTHEQ